MERTYMLINVYLIITVFGGTCVHLLRLENNAYEGVLVAVNPQVPEQEGGKLIDAIKNLFQRSSRLLFSTTFQHASFGQVTIVLPKTWTGRLADKDAFYGYDEAHVRIDAPSPIHGDAPYTQQSGGCGEQGDFIHLTPNYLLNIDRAEQNYGPIDKVFVHEWAHFRYGVFDEYGYPGDPIYPHVHVDDAGKPMLTNCLEPNVHIEFENCHLDQNTGIYNETCKYKLESAQPSTSSLMSFHFLDNVNSFCNPLSHKKDAPTKQNILCKGKSTWEVISQHPDFANFTRKIEPREPRDIVFNVVRTKRSPVYVVLDTSNQMAGSSSNETAFPIHQNRFNYVTKALNIFAEVLPEDTYMGLRLFATTTEEMTPLGQKKGGFASQLTPESGSATFKTMQTAIDQGRKQLVQHKGGIILLVTSGVREPSDIDIKINDLCHSLQQDNVRVVSILYPPFEDYKGSLQKYLTQLADKTNGRNFVIHEMTHGYNTKLNVLSQLTSALLNVGQMIEPSPNDKYMVQAERLHNDRIIRDHFYIDQTSGRNAKFMVLIDKDEDISFQESNLISPSNMRTIMRTPGGPAVPQTVMLSFENAEVGWWNYTIRATKTLTGQPSVAVFVLSYPQSQQYGIEVLTWTNAKTGDVDPNKTPVIIYAEVKKGLNPVLGARVIAKLQRPLDNTNTHTIAEIELLDTGNGAPDIVKNDGIYSRYFTAFNLQGQYLVNVVVTNTENTRIVTGTSASSAVHPKNLDIPYCCGSIVPVKDANYSGYFNRHSNGGVFNVNQTLKEGFNFPPSRITDLHIKAFNSKIGELTLTWTAPGEDLDEGTPASYEMKWSDKRQQLLDSFSNLESIAAPDPSNGGSTQAITIKQHLDPEPKTIHYAIRTKDHSEQDSEISNIVTVRYPAEALSTTSFNPGTSITTSPQPSSRPPLSTAQITIIGSVIGIFILIIICVVIAICIIKRRRNKAPPPKPYSPPNKPKIDNSFKNVPIDENPIRSQPKLNGNSNVYSVSEQMSSPQFMSASEVLAKHAEMRATKDKDYLDHDYKPPFPEDDNHFSPTYDHIHPVITADYSYMQPNQQDYYISRHDNVPSTNPFLQNYPYGRTSLSDKPSSSFTSLSTNEPKKDNGYFTSYEETSEDSNQLRPPGENEDTLTASKSSLNRRIIAESQV